MNSRFVKVKRPYSNTIPVACNGSGILHGASPDGSEHIFVRMGCGHCDYCSERRRRKWLKRIARTAEAHRLTRLLTLTLDPAKLRDPSDIVAISRHLRRSWAKFRTYFAREYGVSPLFVTVMETGRRATHLHLHVLLGQYVDQKWISDVWSRLGGGRVVHIRYVDVHNVSRYLAKYVTKDSFPRSLLRRVRQFTASLKTWVNVKKVQTDWSWEYDSGPLVFYRCQFDPYVSWEQTVGEVTVAFGLGKPGGPRLPIPRKWKQPTVIIVTGRNVG